MYHAPTNDAHPPLTVRQSADTLGDSTFSAGSFGPKVFRSLMFRDLGEGFDL